MALVGNVRMIKTWNAGQLRRHVPAEEACRFPWAPGLPSVAEDLAAAAAATPEPTVPVPALLSVAGAPQPARLFPVA